MNRFLVLPTAFLCASISANAANLYTAYDIGSLGGQTTYGADINSFGQVVGVSSTSGSIANNVFITGPNGIGMTDLGQFAGGTNYANSINSSGQIVVNSGLYGYRSFVTGPAGVGSTELLPIGATGPYPTDSGSIASWGINQSGGKPPGALRPQREAQAPLSRGRTTLELLPLALSGDQIVMVLESMISVRLPEHHKYPETARHMPL